ncbi:SIMPL domain-containing protein, partial [Sandarakinorhabdus rubra]|uniref:SIMPL domain-containing protein n=1 Tax=Sandarakinorhabdus rubra TaxID=2672568 RepID=UPI001F21A0AA
MRHLPLAAALLALVAMPAQAHDRAHDRTAGSAGEPILLSLSADAEVRQAPDTIRFNAGVVTDAPTAAAAVAANAARMAAVVAALKSAGVAAADIQTSSLSIAPQYRYEQGQAPAVTGYQARNSVTVKSSKLADAGKIVDAIVKAGANEVNGPMFSLADPEAALNAARTAAVAKARARAAVYAAAAGLTVKRIVSLSEAGAPA